MKYVCLEWSYKYLIRNCLIYIRLLIQKRCTCRAVQQCWGCNTLSPYHDKTHLRKKKKKSFRLVKKCALFQCYTNSMLLVALHRNKWHKCSSLLRKAERKRERQGDEEQRLIFSVIHNMTWFTWHTSYESVPLLHMVWGQILNESQWQIQKVMEAGMRFWGDWKFTHNQ